MDKAAWTESIPVYSTVEVSICNICGQDVTDNTSAHATAHMKAGEGLGQHGEVQREFTGYDTGSHAEEGHWETGGHGRTLELIPDDLFRTMPLVLISGQEASFSAVRRLGAY